MGSEYDVHPWILFFYSIYYVLLLHHASTYADSKIIPLLHLLLFKLPQCSEKTLVRIVSDTASIEYNNIGIFSVLRLHITSFQEHSRNGFRVMLVHLAATGGNVKFLFQLFNLPFLSKHQMMCISFFISLPIR